MGQIQGLASDIVLWGELIDTIFPIGIEINFANNTDPNALYQGTSWERVQGSFAFASDVNHPLGTFGGEETHTLTIDEMPKHNHNFLYKVTNIGQAGNNAFLFSSQDVTTPISDKISEVGGGQAHNIMPPYRVVNTWRRIA